MAFTTVVDRAVGYALVEADWDTYIKDNQNSGIWVQLANSTLAAPAASIDFTGISESWAHLMLVAYLRGDAAFTTRAARARFNGDTAANYDHQYLYGQAATAGAVEAFAETSIYIGSIPASTAPANLFGATEAYVPHYANSANNKACVVNTALKYGTSSGNLIEYQVAGFWRSNAAITQVTIFAATGNLAAGCRVGLFGLP